MHHKVTYLCGVKQISKMKTSRKTINKPRILIVTILVETYGNSVG